MRPQSLQKPLQSSEPGFDPLLRFPYFPRSLPFLKIPNFPGRTNRKKISGGSKFVPDPGTRNFRIFITPKKFTSIYSKDFLPKLIFLRKGVHHPKFRFSGVRENCAPAKRVSTTFLVLFSIFCDLWYFL